MLRAYEYVLNIITTIASRLSPLTVAPWKASRYWAMNLQGFGFQGLGLHVARRRALPQTFKAAVTGG